MRNSDTFKVAVICPDGRSDEKTAQFATVPGQVGEIGVMANHSPSFVMLKPGTLQVQSGPKDESLYFVPRGFAKIDEKSLTVLTPYFEGKADIDIKRAESARDRAVSRLQDEDEAIDITRAKRALERAEERLRIAQS